MQTAPSNTVSVQLYKFDAVASFNILTTVVFISMHLSARCSFSKIPSAHHCCSLCYRYTSREFGGKKQTWIFKVKHLAVSHCHFRPLLPVAEMSPFLKEHRNKPLHLSFPLSLHCLILSSLNARALTTFDINLISFSFRREYFHYNFQCPQLAQHTSYWHPFASEP